MQLWDDADVALMSIGAPIQSRPGYGPQHHLRRRDQLAHAIGDVAARYFDLRGQHIPYDDEHHLLATSWEQIEAVTHRIGIGVGANKAISLIGAARSGLVDIVVTDAATARKTLEILSTDRRA